ncbi:MAG: hypothetical protein M1838_002795 [Thelocarpon superellum]|nr:MAG: hypothetical protein M1838_002795 [Thelocarpon superellum]
MDPADVMAVDTDDFPRHVERDLSSDSGGPRRDSTEDADPSLTRKRQRLDSSAAAASRSMSADRAPALDPRPPHDAEPNPDPDPEYDHDDDDGRPNSSTSLPPSTSLPHLHTPEPSDSPSSVADEDPSAALSSHKRNSSKVTINVRTPRTDNVPEPPLTPSVELTAEKARSSSPTSTAAPATDARPAGAPPARTPSTHTSVASSPAPSPEVEVAEVEDMDQDYADTAAWTPLVSMVAAGRHGLLIERFPFYTHGCDPKQVVTQVMNVLEKGSETNANILAELRNWFAECVAAAEHPSFEWYEVYSEQQLFWDEVPALIEGLLRRRARFEGSFHHECLTIAPGNSRCDLEDLLIQFISLCRQLILVDLNTLEQSRGSKEEPDLIAGRYQVVLSWTLMGTASTEVGLWQVLEKEYGFDVDDMISRLVRHLTQSPRNIMPHLPRYTDLVLERIPLCHKMFRHTWHAAWIAQRIIAVAIDHIASGQGDGEGDESEAADDALWRRIPHHIAELGQIIYHRLEEAISSQHSLPRELVKEACYHLQTLLFDVAQADRALGRRLLEEKDGPSDEIKNDDLPDLLSRAWKFIVLRKCIVAGRMETRAQGLEIMSDELLDTWQKYGVKGIGLPPMQYLASFILKHRLVEYLIGVDSHLQLMERSSNVIGFLIVTNKYTTRETDTIWHTVRTSENPRVVSAVLHMIKGIFPPLTYSSLLYLCQKLIELPLPAFDGPMLSYASGLLHATREKFRHLQQARLDSTPYHLCIRLVREATALDAVPHAGFATVSRFALKELHELMHWGPEADERHRIYEECLLDIGEYRPTATGSICVINTLLNQHQSLGDTRADLTMLATEGDLTRRLIDELDHHLHNTRPLDGYPPVLKPRLDLVAEIILTEPATITAPLGKQLWDCLLNDHTLAPADRDAAWTTLCGVMNRLRARNALVDGIINDYLPTLDPRNITPAVLGFAQQAIQYEHRIGPARMPQPPAEDGAMIVIPGVELIWRIILRAPDDAIAAQATQYLVGVYLAAPSLTQASPAAVEATHLALTDRCVQRLLSAASTLKALSDGTASGEDEPMVLVASDDELREEELGFSRSLLLLREILARLRTRPQPSPQVASSALSGRSPSPARGDEVLGERVQVRYQASVDNSQPAMRQFDVGTLETCEDLKRRLAAATGFARFKLYCAGFLLDLDTEPHRVLGDLSLGPSPVIIVNQLHDRAEAEEAKAPAGLSVVEIEVLKHFDELYELLGIDEHLACQIWDLLYAFPPQRPARHAVLVEGSITTLFPPGLPFKIMYSTRTFRTCLDEQVQMTQPDEAFIGRGVRSVVGALSQPTLLDGVADHDLTIKVRSMLVDCLLRFLKEPVADVTSAAYFPDPAGTVGCLVDVVKATRVPRAWSPPEAKTLTCDSFAVILEASLHSAQVWTAFTTRPDTTELVQHLMLDDFRVPVRERTGQIIASFCKVLPMPAKVTAREFAAFFWQLLSAILPQATGKQASSQQLFDAALAVFRAVGESGRDVLKLSQYVREWGQLLIEHHHDEAVGRETIDHLVFGFTRLLHWCIQLARSFKQPLQTGELARDLFGHYLFPELSPLTSEGEMVARVPILHSPTRHELNQLLLSLCQDPGDYQRVLTQAAELVDDPSAYNLGWQYQRSKWIRSPTGYVGLHNLSNTCYLNSLFTQLFMNVNFRGFMLDANVADAEGSQKLLAETQKLFAHMQNSWQVSVEPKDLAASIRTYDDDNIDVTVQMDVDEFYNLLFDRWEGQILSDEAKKTFRAFYGGQLVQQVKSKECTHISEREEPFSAIQCDIKGKATLQDSLQAYVEGDIMQGDNKYSCTACGRHVDAVKRTCLKEVPDHLIFHLKRFDFDLRQMQRSKINDHFAFPDTLDMSPYTVAHVTAADAAAAPAEDMFELVGVLVHSGTAESGHYYSFIRERPITSLSQTSGWVQFNDAEVSSWDPANLAAQCFGGPEGWPQVRGEPALLPPKQYSAYMLFYQRASALAAEQQSQQSFSAGCPKKLPVPRALGNYIACENELFIRKYCLCDPFHAPWVRSMLNLLPRVHPSPGTADHETERLAIGLTVQHVDQIVGRMKDAPDVESLLASLVRIVAACPRCCKLAIDEITSNPELMRNLLLRCPMAKLRHDFALFFMTALRALREDDAKAYGIELVQEEPLEWTEGAGAFQDVLGCMDGFWEVIECHMRAWDDYFGLLVQLASLGEPELIAVLHEGFLRRCLEVLVADYHAELRVEYERMLRLMSKGRKVSYHRLIELLSLLLCRLDLQNRRLARHEEERTAQAGLDSYPLTKDEEACLVLHLRHNKSLVFLSKILDVNHNPVAARSIVAHLVLAEPPFGWLHNVHKTLAAGIAIDPASLAGPYLQAAVTFCEYAPGTSEVKDLILRTAREVDTIGGYGGYEHLQFFRSLVAVRNLRWPNLLDFFHLRVLEAMRFWAPVLLLYYDRSVRLETEALVNKIAFDYDVPADEHAERVTDTIQRAARELGAACLHRIHEQYIGPNSHTDSKFVAPICRVLGRCRDYFEEVEDTDFGRQFRVVMAQLMDLAVEEVEDVASEEWDNDSNMASDSSEIDPTSQAVELSSP